MTRMELARAAEAVGGEPVATDTGVGRASEPLLHEARTEPLLELSGVTKRWRGIDRAVLDDVHLSLQPGSGTWISGRNGTGKTTLMRIAAGLIGADTGHVRLSGLDPVADRGAYQARTRFLSAGSGGLYARLSVEWHLDWWGRLAFLQKSRRRELAESALQQFDLGDLRRRRVDRLSMGQRQRVRLAGTFLCDAELILLDEARNSLDAEGLELVGKAVAEAMSHGAAVVWSAPTGEEAASGFHRRLLLEHGRLVPA